MPDSSVPPHPPAADRPLPAGDLLIDAEDTAGPAPRPAHPLLVAAGLVLVALNLRPALSSVSPVLAELVRDTGVSATAASVLTTVPVLCLGVFGLLAPRLAQRRGAERVVLAAVAVLAAGLALRLVPWYAAQLAASVIAGAGIGVAGALLPGIVKRDFADRPALMTGVYTMALCAGAAIAAGATVPLAGGPDGWPVALAFWALPAAVAALVWLPLLPRRTPGAAPPPRQPVRGLWRDPLAWQVTLFMGLQSSLAYIVLGWLAVILRDRGLGATAAGLVVSVSVLVQVAAALIGPVLAARRRSQGGAAAIALVLTVAGMLGCLFAPVGTVWLWAVLLGLGQGASFAIALTLIVLRAGDSHVAAHLSGMAQSVGYTLAAAGPFAVGLLHDRTGSWAATGVLTVVVGAAAIAAGFGAGRDRVVLSGVR
ncbi:CynX/NimT family MFS transporter [Azospirillum halopraeferens]|uniref:CynX/NimT family MFS transporter n=1 Tax=Azospirillum halopraeferens TaxID=34010 RepID=UPI0004239E45|nr:MFS transporter [Azospirillum halopraeferens]